MPELSRQTYLIYDLPKTKAVHSDEWEEKRLGDLADVVGGGTPDTGIYIYWNPPTIPWVTPTDITACDDIFLSRTERGISEAGLRSSSATLLPPGTTLLTSRATVGECRICKVRVATNQGFASLVPRELDGNFLFYMTQHLKPVFCRLAAGTTYAEVSRREVRKVRCYLPKDKEEQNRIATVLLLADKTISDLKVQLNATQRLKIALVQQLFTKGIPGRHTRFKETKIGEVPEEWDVLQLGSALTSVQYGLSDGFDERGRYQILRMMNVDNGYVHTRDPVFIDLDDITYAAYRLEVGDILFNRTNSLELVGRVGIVRETIEAVFASYLVRLKANREKVDPFFLNYCLNSYQVQCRYRRFATPAVGQANINPRNLKKTLIALPTKKSGEQEEILSVLKGCDATMEATAKKLNALIYLKKSLLQNLLTGKVRVNMEAKA